MMQRLQREADAVLTEIVELTFHMKNVSYEEMMRRAPVERQKMRSFVEHHYDEQAKAMQRSTRKGARNRTK